MQKPMSNVQRLRQACGGQDKDGAIYGKLFSPIKSCELLISVDGFDKSLQKSETSWIRLAITLLPIIEKSDKCKRVFMNLLRLILTNRHLDGREKFLNFVWKYLERNMTSNNLELMEVVLSKDPECLEIGIISLLMKSINERDSKNSIREHPTTQWCSRSRIVFSTATSIMNEILLRSIENPSLSEKISNVIYSFKCCVAETCDDTTSLYPLKYQGLVSMLQCMEGADGEESVENETATDKMHEKEIKKRVAALVDSKLKNDTLAALAILSHHPPFISFLHCDYNP
ncbi:uncharacterized protein LOC111044328 [Nilaparvata lugens]|uniref:uncharacterized protein LOC111044328 n=1 Tax=Nilaparvata lugens TaxID=108931 RepID=UPI00193D4C24|nr:uncharacterized protein LOC111044328 [Nilaparvata lugens]